VQNKHFETVADLSAVVHSRMISLHRPCPSLDALRELFQILFNASLHREESSDLLFDIVVLEAANPDPNPPIRPTYDRSAAYVFSTPLGANIANIVKLARASDPRASSFACDYDQQRGWYIWGMVDQSNQYYSFLNRATTSGSMRPGLFQASIAGAGHLVIYVEYEKLAELIIDRLVSRTHDVFWRGPVHNKLLPGINSYISKVASTVGLPMFNKRGHWSLSLSDYWIASLCSLLLRIQGLRHGGALLLNPEAAGLKIKYQLPYDRLQQSLLRRAILHIAHTDVSDKIFQEVLDTNSDEVPVDYYLEESISGTDITENDKEVDGALWFIACLSRVDGLIVMDKNLSVLGFGAEITLNEIPKAIIKAKSRFGGTKRGLVLDYEHFGTRHRSMMRYIGRNPASVGFVISQDGEVRAMTQVNGKVVVWDDLKLQRGFPARRKSRSKTSSP
jgi:hypothetical protein